MIAFGWLVGVMCQASHNNKPCRYFVDHQSSCCAAGGGAGAGGGNDV
jgi:hypothetical protein